MLFIYWFAWHQTYNSPVGAVPQGFIGTCNIPCLI